jgi:hypothetical protein
MLIQPVGDSSSFQFDGRLVPSWSVGYDRLNTMTAIAVGSPRTTTLG